MIIPDTTRVAVFSKQNTADILNAIKYDAQTPATYSVVPDADAENSNSLKEIGGIILGNPVIANDFCNALFNRIAMVLVTSTSFINPWAVFKRGLMELGDVVEEVFVELAEPHVYDIDEAEREIFKRENPEILSAFHVLNWQTFYKTTIERPDLERAFLSWDGVTDLIQRIVASMATALEYDEFMTMKYMLGKNALAGLFYTVKVDGTASPQTDIVSIKEISVDSAFVKTKYNPYGVHNNTPIDEQYLLVNAKYAAKYDVEVMANAFNMEKVQFLGHQITYDSLGDLDWERLDKLLEKHPGYRRFTEEEVAALESVKAILVDRKYFMVFDKLLQSSQIENGQGLYWNHWLHSWKIFSTSPFVTQVLFTDGEEAITKVSVSPESVTLKLGGYAQFIAEVEAKGFTSTAVNWTIDSEISRISSNGRLTVSTNETASSITVTATSKVDSTKSGTATVTISNPVVLKASEKKSVKTVEDAEGGDN